MRWNAGPPHSGHLSGLSLHLIFCSNTWRCAGFVACSTVDAPYARAIVRAASANCIITGSSYGFIFASLYNDNSNGFAVYTDDFSRCNQSKLSVSTDTI
jgi:hypothetical protein